MMRQKGDHYLMLEDKPPYRQGEVLKVNDIYHGSELLGAQYINKAGSYGWLYHKRVLRIQEEMLLHIA